MMIEKMYSVTEFGAALGLSSKTIRRWISEGRINAVKIGAHWRISHNEILRLQKGENE